MIISSPSPYARPGHTCTGAPAVTSAPACATSNANTPAVMKPERCCWAP